MKIVNECSSSIGKFYPHLAYGFGLYFYPENKKRFSLNELKEIVQEMEKVVKIYRKGMLNV